MISTELTNIPGKDAAPETGDLPKNYGVYNNLASDEKLAEKFWAKAQPNFESFRTNTRRVKFCGPGGSMDIADKMERVSLQLDTTSKQYMKSRSNVASTIFFRNTRTITSNINKILGLLDTEELPAEYNPDKDQRGPQGVYKDDNEGKYVAQQMNELESLTFSKDKRREKLKDFTWSLCKYGNALTSEEWDRQVVRRQIKKVTHHDKQGTPTNWTWEEKEVVIKDCPGFFLHDLKDAYFDAQVENEQHWRWFFLRQQKPWEELAADQNEGWLKNVNKLTASELYEGVDNTTEDDRSTNAGVSATSEANGLWEIWQCWARVPITENMGKNGPTGRGKWDDKNAPVLYWATFAGKMGSSQAICLRLVKNPYKHGRFPYKLSHLLRDDKGAYHDGLADKTAALYWQKVTNDNQANDNINLRNEAPWWTDGRINTDDLTFRRNKLLKLGRGTQLKQLDVADTTAFTLPNSDRIERDFEKTTGADKPVQGVETFSRTAATVGKLTHDQSMIPVDDMAAYVSDQLFNWMFELDYPLWQQYGDPELILTVTENNLQVEFTPAHIIGPLKVRVTCVNRFRNNQAERAMLNNLAQNVWPIAKEDSTPEGRKTFWRWLLEQNKVEPVGEIFPVSTDYDAEEAALNELNLMLNVGEFVEPRFEQNQKAHLRVEEAKRAWAITVKDEMLQERIRDLLDVHIAMEKDFMAQKESSASVQSQQSQSGQPPMLEGNQIGDIMEAQEGQQNAG